MAISYPGRTFAGSRNPAEWFGNVNPAKTPWTPRSTAGGMPTAGNIPGDMWASARAQAPGDLGGVEDPEQARASMMALNASNDMGANKAMGEAVIRQRRAAAHQAYDQAGSQGLKTVDLGRDYGLGYQNDNTPWGDFFTILTGKEANLAAAGKRMKTDLTGFGRNTGYDPVLGKSYNLDAGEGPPSEYSNAEQDYIMHSGPALNALRRATGNMRPALPSRY